MIEHLMSSSLSGDYEGCAAGFIELHVRGLRSHQQLIARVVVCVTGAVHTNIFRSIRYVRVPPEQGDDAVLIFIDSLSDARISSLRTAPDRE